MTRRGSSVVKRQSVSGVLKKKESFLKFLIKGFLHHAAPAAPIVNSVAGRAVPRLHLLVVLLHGHAPAVLLLHVLAALEVRAECHLPLLRNGVAACHLVVVRAAAHLLLVLVTTHASGVDFGCWRGSEGSVFLVGWYFTLRNPGIYSIFTTGVK
jgi:hypothetical protein